MQVYPLADNTEVQRNVNIIFYDPEVKDETHAHFRPRLKTKWRHKYQLCGYNNVISGFKDRFTPRIIF